MEPLSVDGFNETTPEGRAAVYKIKHAVATASQVEVSRVSVELVHAGEDGRRRLQTAPETTFAANVTSDDNLSTALDFHEFGPAFIGSFEEQIELPPEIQSELPANYWVVETCIPADSGTAMDSCDAFDPCALDRRSNCESGGTCTHSPSPG